MTISFNYHASTRTHLFDYHDSIMLIGTHQYNGQDFLLYLIEWENDLTIRYMVTPLQEGELDTCKQGVKAFLQSKWQQNELYHYTCNLADDLIPHDIRPVTQTELPDFLPIDEFSLQFEYTGHLSWVQ